MVVDPKDVDAFLAYAAEENLEAVTVAEVTESPRLTMTWRGKTIVDLSRAFSGYQRSAPGGRRDLDSSQPGRNAL